VSKEDAEHRRLYNLAKLPLSQTPLSLWLVGESITYPDRATSTHVLACRGPHAEVGLMTTFLNSPAKNLDGTLSFPIDKELADILKEIKPSKKA
jgi:hypothetical protein